MEMKLISIIVPIYNAQEYLKELIESIRNQSYTEYEVILINDGSTDESEKICLEYKQKDKKIKYFKKNNTGVSDTRNYGIQKANGTYICFVDADDILSKDFLKDLFTIITKNNGELACCGYVKFKDKITKNNDSNENIYTIDINNKYDLLYGKFGGYLWNKLFLKSIIDEHQISFNTKISMCEDMLFIFDYLEYVNKIICTNKNNYNYRVIKTAASKDLTNLKWFTIFQTFDILIEKKEKVPIQSFNRLLYAYIFYLYEGKYRLKFIKNENVYSDYKNDIHKRLKSVEQYKNQLSYKNKIKILIYRYFNMLAFKLKKR